MADPGDGRAVRGAETPPGTAGESTVEMVRQASLSLLASLPQRPERLRMQVADVVIDLDWRLPFAAAALPPADGSSANQHVASLESASPQATQSLQAEAQRSDLHYVRAPSVGTFYRAPKPGAAPFVTEGTVVSAGQQVGIVEAMKLMLPVEADQAGEVVQILAADGQVVEYDELLLALAPVTG